MSGCHAGQRFTLLIVELMHAMVHWNCALDEGAVSRAG
jgi:hypothetical protein